MDEVTPLSPSQEASFQAWAQRYGISDVNDPRAKYDYRGYWLETSGAPHKRGDHFPDTYKQHGHPTFSVESKYSSGPGDGGRWDGERFIPQEPKGNKRMTDTGASQTNDLIAQLAAMLEKNRQERQAGEAQRLNAASGLISGIKGGMANKKAPEASASAGVDTEPSQQIGAKKTEVLPYSSEGADKLMPSPEVRPSPSRAFITARDAAGRAGPGYADVNVDEMRNPYKVYDSPPGAEQAVSPYGMDQRIIASASAPHQKVGPMTPGPAPAVAAAPAQAAPPPQVAPGMWQAPPVDTGILEYYRALHANDRTY